MDNVVRPTQWADPARAHDLEAKRVRSVEIWRRAYTGPYGRRQTLDELLGPPTEGGDHAA